MDQIIANSIKFFISNFPIIMTALALLLGLLALMCRKKRSISNIFLARLMFLAVGLAGLWGFVLHACFPDLASKFIGWAPSPFQFEVAVANLGMGVAGIFGTRASKGYRIATTIFTTCFLWGAAAGHVMQMLKAGNFAPGNAGLIFYNDLILPALLILFLLFSKKSARAE